MPGKKTISLLKLKKVANHSPERVFSGRKQEKIKSKHSNCLETAGIQQTQGRRMEPRVQKNTVKKEPNQKQRNAPSKGGTLGRQDSTVPGSSPPSSTSC